MAFVHGSKLLSDLLSATGFNPGDPYQRVVIVCDVNDIPKVYVTRVLDADRALRVVETLRGVEVTADESVEIVTLTESK